MTVGTNLTQVEVNDLTDGGFRLVPLANVHSPTLVPRSHCASAYERGPTLPKGQHPIERFGIPCRRSDPTAKHETWKIDGDALICEIKAFKEIPHPRYGCIYTMQTEGSMQIGMVYQVYVGQFSFCDCPEFL